ncbi:UNKNOWN [Stylonychia lemnae]|uniref:Uncharacterized protein n=1 Tax=Stylonychia lemnae TaxID=5949 RepID=A0A078A3V4_STYLE|nr:UNKNOWN [Stylonychia lemnae]|eukprot:CDW76938.1 UNKNOWN [Stylonychia lemnae]
MGACLSRQEEFNAQVGQFEKSLPFSKISIQDYQERVKRLVFEGDQDQITLRQLIESFKDNNSFHTELSTEGSELRSIFLSKYLKKPQMKSLLGLDGKNQAPQKISEQSLADQNDLKIWVTGLLMLGILYCQGSARVKANVFFEILQKELNSDITHQDQEFITFYPIYLQYATSLPYHFTAIRLGKELDEDKEKDEEEELETIYDSIKEELIDLIYGTYNNKVSRSEFIDKLSGSLWRYLDANELRKILDKKLKENSINSYLKSQLDELGGIRVNGNGPAQTQA